MTGQGRHPAPCLMERDAPARPLRKQVCAAGRETAWGDHRRAQPLRCRNTAALGHMSERSTFQL